jgi:cytochrome c-type biogenesis protein
VIGFAAAMYFQYDTLITAWLSSLYPSAQIGL